MSLVAKVDLHAIARGGAFRIAYHKQVAKAVALCITVIEKSDWECNSF